MTPDNKFGLMLGLSIAELCCCFPITGIIGIIFAVIANNAYKAGDYETYEAKAKTVKIVLLVGLGLGIVIGILTMVLYGGMIAATLGSSTY